MSMSEITDLEFTGFRLSVFPMADSAVQLRLHPSTPLDTAQCARVVAGLSAPLRKIDGITAVVPSFDSVTLWLAPGVQTDLLLEQVFLRLSQISANPQLNLAGQEHAIWLSRELEAEFQGDLAFCAAHAGMTPERWLTRFCETEFTVGCLGFRPGFGYLLGLPEDMACPRRADPRMRVPAGAIAIGGAYAGIYPNAGPGGWHVLGQCLEPLFDPAQSSPCRFAVGDSVRFYL